MQPQLNLALAKSRNDELARAARARQWPSPEGPAREAIVLREAAPGDAGALCRLIMLDSSEASPSGAWLVAEVDGELVAALPVRGGRPVADPFRPTDHLLALLRMRARHLGMGQRSRLARLWRGAPVTG